MMREKMKMEPLLHAASRAAEPSPLVRANVWERVRTSMHRPAQDVLSHVSGWLTPSLAQRTSVRMTLRDRMAEQVTGWLHIPSFRFVTAVAMVALIVRISPLLFLAQKSSAESQVLLLPTRGAVELSLQGLWQETTVHTPIQEGVELRTVNGEGTVVLHDDGNVRLDSGTHVILRDISDRPDIPSVTGPSLTLLEGRVWVQGLLPQNVRGITVATAQGDITVREGSVSIGTSENGEVRLSVWDRHAVVEHDGRSTTLVSGEYTRLTDAPAFLVQEASASAYADAWVSQNLDRDAVHRREIAQLQKERSRADAGILPTSPFYQVKRIAEQMDLLMTLDGTEKVKKQLAFASTRLDEAAALIAQGGEADSAVPLEEYRRALLQVATSSGADALTKQLVQEQVEQSAADIAAVTPTESEYLVKKAVLEASASLPDTPLQKTDVEAIILVDTLDALHAVTASGDIAQVQATFIELRPYLKSIKEGKSDITPEVRKEALALLQDFAQSVSSRSAALGDVDDALMKATDEYLPPPPVAPSLTDEQVDVLVAQMKARIYSYKLTRSRWNQLHAEFRSIADHSDRGRILRALYHALPENGLAPYVRTEIQNVRETLDQ